MNNNINIEKDLEFYCFLKKNLPAKYTIIAEPSPNYYSEWEFHYKIYKENNMFDEFKGNFKDIDEGSLVNEAKRIIKELRGQDVNWK
ncbi:MAG: hypothetical protein U5N56_00900 [Candidatus Marinimicrobia bacterium]|nr:hypothetical protein [Candidatus Neomarinimicrobiota bacterium]